MSPDASLHSGIIQAGKWLREFRHAIALTGAGLSTPSGIPDFRSPVTGLWERNNPMEVASLTSFRRQSGVFFDWLKPLVRQINAASPNPAHAALANLENAGLLKAVITQNIDGLHQQAGSNHVLEMHGSLKTFTCQACRCTLSSEGFTGPFINEGIIPLCPACKTVLKPDIVLFEEELPSDTWNLAMDHLEKADLLLVAGTSLEVMPVGNLPQITLSGGARLIIINLSDTYLDPRADILLRGDVADILPEIAESALHPVAGD